MRDNARIGWGFEVQRFKISTPRRHKEFTLEPGQLWSPEDDQIWTPNSRLITGKNVVIDLAQEELLKIWRALQGSVRQIENIAVGDGLTEALDTDVTLESELDSKNILSWDDSLISPDSGGLSEVKAQVVWLSLEAIGRLSEIGLKFDNGDLVTRALFKKLTVSGATQANPVRITTDANHGLVTGDEIHLDNLGGMVELNDRDFVITVIDADEFDLDGEDGTGHTVYTTGGDAWLVLTKTTGEVVQTNYVLTMLS